VEQQEEEPLTENDSREDFANASRSTEIDPYIPYGIPCIRELFRFLISLCNPHDIQNNDNIIHIALNLLTVVFEVASDNIGNFFSLITLVKDELCKNLFQLLNTERLPIFAANLQVCFLLFESLRYDLKFQLEHYLIKLTDIIGSENIRVTYEIRELALDNLLQLLRVPGFAAELYINYDCDLYCANIFENITKLLSKNALLAIAGTTIYGTQLLSLDALFTIISSIEKSCTSYKKLGNFSKRHSRNNSSARADMFDESTDAVYIKNMDTFIQYNTMCTRFSGKFKIGEILTEAKMEELKNKKRILAQGTDLFNQRPEKGIQFLQENGILNLNLEPLEVAHFLRESPGLDKKMIGEYISKKKNVEKGILEVFVKSFDFTAMRIDKALRLYLETFRLPGEAPLIFLVMEHFADHWHKCNNEPFANTDAAFRLAYAIIMLNMDQHNHNAKKLNVPMTVEDFTKNLRGLNGNLDFEQEMLIEVFNAIKNEEIIMPAEQTGMVRENYLWKVLLRRGEGKDGEFIHVSDSSYDKQLFQVTWGSTLTAFASLFDKISEISVVKRIMEGFMHSAAICSHYSLHQEFDAIILTLCKFTTLYNTNETNEINGGVQFGSNSKARTAMKSVFKFLHDYGDSMRESWKQVIDLIVQMYKMKLLPKSFVEIEDFCEDGGKIVLQYEPLPVQKSESGIFSSLYLYLSSESQRQPSYEEQEILKLARKCIKDCQIDQMIVESKFLHHDSLAEIIAYLQGLIKAPTNHKSVGIPYEENLVIFYLELLTKILIQNRDRVLPYWPRTSEIFHELIVSSASCGYENLLKRSTVALLKLGIYLMRNEELASTILQSMKIFLRIRPKILNFIAVPVAIGMYELLKTSAQNIHTEQDWSIVFNILECVGAGAISAEACDVAATGKILTFIKIFFN
jgi:brefeldin A-resistance guanine nucleotide exchange factor 1